ncbi:NAD(P)-binding protein [Epithele typhae]|uniref:NAD(P)-binding protein n=1 Tax=Epithele typhae TaxID=378194 RepID=UPI002007B9C6|nr:NAD(P)-binding protein [Epithele typhae]KAH9934463.1 NAD(P)-binding protein [Epithele typhae]
MASRWNDFWAPQPPEWGVDDVPDQSGKVFLVTGGDSGLGLALAKVLLARNATVYVTARTQDDGRRVVDALRRTSEAVRLLAMDLADLHSVRRAAGEYLSREARLHVLINSAWGSEVRTPPIQSLTRQGYDLQFGANVLGHFYLTQLLLPVMLVTAKTTGEKVRVLNHTLDGIGPAQVDYSSLMRGPVRAQWSTTSLYRQSKLCNLLVSLELAEQYGEQGILSISVSTGADVSLQRRTSYLWDIIWGDASKAPIAALCAATSPKCVRLNGQLLGPLAKVLVVSPQVADKCARDDLWDWLEAQTSCFDRVTINCHSVSRVDFAQDEFDDVKLVAL